MKGATEMKAGRLTDVYVGQMKGLKRATSHGAALGITLGRGHADTGSGLCFEA